jgi:hypothetical protein
MVVIRPPGMTHLHSSMCQSQPKEALIEMNSFYWPLPTQFVPQQLSIPFFNLESYSMEPAQGGSAQMR